MPGNSIKINGCSELEWYVGDSQMEKVIAVLDEAGAKTQDGDILKDYGKALAESVAMDEEVFTKKELQKIRQKAEDLAEVVGMNPSWVIVYLKIANACSALDAKMVECEEKEEVEKDSK